MVDEVKEWTASLFSLIGTLLAAITLCFQPYFYTHVTHKLAPILPVRWKYAPSAVYALLVPALSRHVLDPVCRQLVAMEGHTRTCSVSELLF